MANFKYKELTRTIDILSINFYGDNYFTGLINFSENHDLSDLEVLSERYFTYMMNIFEFGYIKDILIPEETNDLYHILDYFAFPKIVINNLVFQSQLSLLDQEIKAQEDRLRYTFCNIVENDKFENIGINLFEYDFNIDKDDKDEEINYQLIDLSFCKLNRPKVNIPNLQKNIESLSYNTLKLLPLNEPEFAQHLFIAGGFVLGCLLNDNFDIEDDRNKKKMSAFDDFDIDIFIYGLKNEEESNIFLKKLCHKITERKNIYSESFRNDLYFSRNNHTITLYIFDRFSYNGKYERSNFQIQFILRLYESPEQILCGFDVDSCCIGFTNNSLIALPRFIRAYKEGYNLIDPNRESPSYTYRLIKYSLRGFKIAVLSHVYKEYKEQIDNTLFFQGIGKLILCEKKLDKFNISEKYKRIRKIRYRRYTRYINKKIVPTIKLYYTKYINDQDLYDFIEFIKNIEYLRNLNSVEEIINYLQNNYPESRVILSNKNYNFNEIIKNEIIIKNINKNKINNNLFVNLFDNITENKKIETSTYDNFYKMNKNVTYDSFQYIKIFCNLKKKDIYFSQNVNDIFELPEEYNIPRNPSWINSLKSCLQDSTNEFFKGVF